MRPSNRELIVAARKCLKEQLNDSELHEFIVDEMSCGINESWDEMYEDLTRAVRIVCDEVSEKI